MRNTKKANILDKTVGYDNGFSIQVDVTQDEFMGEPWKEHDGHGIVRKSRSEHKNPGERVLVPGYFYDIQESIKIAKRDDWGCEHGIHTVNHSDGTYSYSTTHKTKGERAACAVQQDFDYCQGYVNDNWTWVGVIVTLCYTDEEGDMEELGSDSIGGIDGCESKAQRDYCNEEARRMAANLLSKRREYASHIADALFRKAEALANA
jgi:hypothetical protein